MTEKDPEDMTVSELLRWAANDERDRWKNCTPHGKLLSAIAGEDYCSIELYDRRESLSALADKIDAELAQARSEALLQGAKVWAKANGGPDFREGEDFGTWIGRCTFAKPLDDCGEPVQIKERVVDKVRGDIDVSRISYTANGFYFNNSHNSGGTRITYAPGERVERPAPEVLGADGKPIVEGETVYRLSDGTAWKVTKLHHSEHRISVVSVGGKGVTSGGRFLTSEYTHTLPDTQERIDDDATMHPAAYCAAYGIDLGDDPDREKSTTSMIADLLRRQREYDKRKGGAE